MLFGRADVGLMIMPFMMQLGIALVMAYLVRHLYKYRAKENNRRKVDKYRLNQLQQLPPNAALPVIQPQNIIALDPDEEAHASIEVVLMEMQSFGSETHVSGSAVNWGGFTTASGSSTTHSVSKMGTAATGELVITPKRLIFSGDMQTFIFPVEEILGILPTEEGFIINSNYNNRILKINSKVQRQVFDCVIRRVLQNRPS